MNPASALSGKPRPAVVETICEGSSREMGRTQGEAAREKIHGALAALAELEAFRLTQPRWLPYTAYRRLAAGRASRFLDAAFAPKDGTAGDRIAGLAEGAGLKARDLMLLNALEPMLSSVGGCTACPGACSAAAIRGSRSATGRPLVARNFDYLPLVQPFYLLRDCRPTGGLRSIEFTTAPLAGAVDGLNEAGLCISYDYGFTIDDPPRPAPPISMAIAAALARCRTTAEAAGFLTNARRWGGALLMLADADGDVASLELSGTRAHVRRPAAGEDVLFHTNAFTHPSLLEVQPPADAVYTDAAPAALRGRRLHRSSEDRERRFADLFADPAPLDADGLHAVMSDHGPDGVPGDFTPCVHGDYWATTACLQFFPHERRLRASYTSACRAEFETTQL